MFRLENLSWFEVLGLGFALGFGLGLGLVWIVWGLGFVDSLGWVGALLFLVDYDSYFGLIAYCSGC